MTVTNLDKNPNTLTMTITAEFTAPPARVWEMWANPRLLERWWGPPTHPATVVEHDVTPGGRVSYFMTGPEGEQYHGWWKIRSVNAPVGLAFTDGFADGDGVPNPDLPTTDTVVVIAEHGDGTRMTVASTFASIEAMEQILAMGMEEGITLAMNQIDALLV